MILHSPVIYTHAFTNKSCFKGSGASLERTLIFSEKEELGREDRRDGIGEEPSVEFVSRKATHRTSGELVGLTGADEYQAGGPYG